MPSSAEKNSAPRSSSRTELTDFLSYEKIDNKNHADILETLSKDAREICKEYVVFGLRGKLTRDVYVLLNKDMLDAITRLIEYREEAEIDPKNPYLFATSGKIDYQATHLSSCALMREYSEKCGAEKPATLRGTELRKHLATNFVRFNLENV